MRSNFLVALIREPVSIVSINNTEMQTLLWIRVPSYLSVCIFINPLFTAKLKPLCMVTGQILPLNQVFCTEIRLLLLLRRDCCPLKVAVWMAKTFYRVVPGLSLLPNRVRFHFWPACREMLFLLLTCVVARIRNGCVCVLPRASWLWSVFVAMRWKDRKSSFFQFNSKPIAPQKLKWKLEWRMFRMQFVQFRLENHQMLRAAWSGPMIEESFAGHQETGQR